MNHLATDPVFNYKKIFDGVNFFMSDGWMSNMSPAELLQFHVEALAWLNENEVRFSKLKSELINWPKECVYWFNMTSEEILRTWIFKADACIQYLHWDQEDIDFYQQGRFHEVILRQSDSYEALNNIVDWSSDEVNRILTDLELKEIQRKKKIYEKYYQKWIVFWQFIRDTKQKITNIFSS